MEVEGELGVVVGGPFEVGAYGALDVADGGVYGD